MTLHTITQRALVKFLVAPGNLCRGLAVAVMALGVLACSPRAPHLTLATTTSVANSGLLDVLLAAYSKDTGQSVHAHLVGSGRALAMLTDGNADVVISHAPNAEAAALRRHPEWRRRKIMFNAFVLAGPSADPARVAGSPDIEKTMRRIARSRTQFVSRGDQSGTHEREQFLWQRAGTMPAADRLVTAGAGMGATLRIASEIDAYTLTDSATFRQHARRLRIVALFEDQVPNVYSVIVNPAGPRAMDAEQFALWLSEGRGRRVIEEFRLEDGTSPFSLWPASGNRSRAHSAEELAAMSRFSRLSVVVMRRSPNSASTTPAGCRPLRRGRAIRTAQL